MRSNELSEFEMRVCIPMYILNTIFPLKVKLAYQESEMVSMLKKIPLGSGELNVIRDRAEKLRDGKLKCRGDALLPLTLASFIFDSLCSPGMLQICWNYLYVRLLSWVTFNHATYIDIESVCILFT